MSYDSSVPAYYTYKFTDDFVYSVPGYLVDGDTLDRSDISDDENDLSGEDPEVREVGSDSIDYSDTLNSISLSVDDLRVQNESLSVQVDTLNSNLVTLQEDNKYLIGFVFCITFIVCLKMVFAIFNKILGLSNC